MTAADWIEVRGIYLEGIATGNATFEKSAPEWEAWDRAHLASCRLVARGRTTPEDTHDSTGGILGWAALSPVSMRRVYAGVTEASVYVAESARGLGVGHALLSALIEASEREGIWTIQASIFPENRPSLTLFGRCGFRVVGTRARLAALDGR
jgi:phosphinothricin acetyltransferase